MNGVCPANGPRDPIRSAMIRRASRCGHRPSLASLNLEAPPPAYDEVIRVPSFVASPMYCDLQDTSHNGPISTIQSETRRFSLNPRNGKIAPPVQYRELGWFSLV
jgi:hypothetical protein